MHLLRTSLTRSFVRASHPPQQGTHESRNTLFLSPSSESPNWIYSAVSLRAPCGSRALLVAAKLAIARIAPGAPLEAVKVGRGRRRRRVCGTAGPGRRRTRSEADHGKREHGNEHKAGHETVLWFRWSRYRRRQVRRDFNQSELRYLSDHPIFYARFLRA